jgi:hypothetical protein
MRRRSTARRSAASSSSPQDSALRWMSAALRSKDSDQ